MTCTFALCFDKSFCLVKYLQGAQKACLISMAHLLFLMFTNGDVP